MRWIKASEPKPNKKKVYVVRCPDAAITGGQAYFNGDKFEYIVPDHEIEWLDESTPTPERTAEEIRDEIAVIATDLMGNLEIHKWWDYGDFEEIRDKDSVGCDIADAVINLLTKYRLQGK